MDSVAEPSAKTPSASHADTPRIRCPACFKQFSNNQNLVQHLEKAGHTEHEPQCEACHKHFFCFESLREHLLGRLAKMECTSEFARRGCNLCLSFLDSEDALSNHRLNCQYVSTLQSDKMLPTAVDSPSERAQGTEAISKEPGFPRVCQTGPVSLDCEMVGGGKDGTVNLCARICMVDEHENVLLHTYVQPFIPVTDFRYQITGIKAADLRNAPTFKRVRAMVKRILGDSRILVGHDLRHDLACLRLDYHPELLRHYSRLTLLVDSLLYLVFYIAARSRTEVESEHDCSSETRRDTATYQLLVKTSGVSHKLRFLTEIYLGYKIQDGASHDPREDAVAAMRLYKRMRSCRHAGALSHSVDLSQLSMSGVDSVQRSYLSAYTYSEPTFYCWCLDSKKASLDQVCS